MAAALPWVDDFVEGHNLESLERLAELVLSDAVRDKRRANGHGPTALTASGRRMP